MKVLSALDRLDVVVAALAATSLVLPAVPTAMTAPVPEAVGLPAVPSLCLAAAALLRVRLARDSGASALAGVIGLGLGAIGPLSWLGLGVSLGGNTPAVFLLLAALVLFAASVMAGLADLADRPGAPAALSLGAPFVFGAALSISGRSPSSASACQRCCCRRPPPSSPRLWPRRRCCGEISSRPC